MKMNCATPVFLIITSLSAAALAQEYYTISYVEITTGDNGLATARLVEKQADLQEVLGDLKSSDEQKRFSVIRALESPDRWAEADRKALIEAMGECLSDEYLPVRYRASQALLMVGSDAVAVLPALIRAAEKEESLTKVNAIGALSNIGPGSKAAIPVLAKLLEADDKFIPMHAGGALACIGEEAVPALIEALNSKKSNTRFQVIEALGQMGTAAKPAIPALQRISTNDEMWLQFRAKGAIEEIGQPSSLRPPFWVYGNWRASRARDPKKQKD